MIQTKPSSPEYRDGWDRIFGRRDAVRELTDAAVELLRQCGPTYATEVVDMAAAASRRVPVVTKAGEAIVRARGVPTRAVIEATCEVGEAQTARLIEPNGRGER